MSYSVFFEFTQGLSKTIMLPRGTIAAFTNHIEQIESILQVKREKYLDNPEYWGAINFDGIDEDELCKAAIEHNNWVRKVHNILDKYAEHPSEEAEELTNKKFQKILPALHFIKVPVEKWNGEYYTNRMEVLYEVMRGRESEGISFNTKALTEKQASNVILLFSEFLDHEDRRLEVPKGHDYLASSYDGGYEWCEKCGAITYEDSLECQRKGCPLQKQHKEEDNTESS